MTTAATAIFASLNTMFAELDAKVLADAIVWGEKRRVAVEEKRKELNRRELGEWSYYNTLFAVAGGKTWFNVFNYADAATVEAFMRKNTAATIAKRNATIAAKLAKVGVTSIASTVMGSTADGFQGTFVVETDAGRKTITINAIYAGGYNIQCFHIRVLVKVR